MLEATIALAAALLLIFIQVPVALALFAVGFAGFAYLISPYASLSMVVIVSKDYLMSYSLIVLPLFVLMGNLIAASGIADELYRAALLIFGRLRGGLAMATIGASAGFGAVCGSSVANAATIGKVAVPSMRSFRYDDGLSAASVAAGGTLGVLIPPSVIMVIYGISTETNIGDLFIAGILPGLLGALLYMLAVRFIVWRNPDAAPPAETMSRDERRQTIRAVLPVALLFLLVIGGIYLGWFTAVEGGGVGAFGALIVALARGSLSVKVIMHVLRDSAATTASLFVVIIGAGVFAELVNQTSLHSAALSVISGSDIPPLMVIALIVIMYVILGCFLESISMILLTLPVFFPVVMALGYDPVWFGVVVVVAVEVGLITPPVGLNLFILKQIVPDLDLIKIFKGILPFIFADFIRIVLIVMIPSISLLLPHLL